MAYNFDEIIDRHDTNSMKWDALQELFGDSDVVPLWVADMDFRVPEPVREALKQVAEHGVYGYTKRPDSFYDSLIQWLDRRHEWHVEKDWITVTPGVVSSLSILVQAFTKPGDEIVIQSPVYHPFFTVIEQNERTLVDNTLLFDGEHYTIDFADLEEKLSSDACQMLVLCSPHNPVGRVWTREELTKMGELCLKHDVLVLSDEVHFDLIFDGHKHIPFASISEAFANQSITCVAPSKTFNLAGLQSSVIIIPNEKYNKQLENSLNIQDSSMTNSFAVAAFEAAYTDGDEWLDALMDYIEKNFRYLDDFIQENIPQVKVIQPEGTYLVWIDFRALGFTAPELESFLLKKAKVALNQGYIFGKAGEGFARINIACPLETLKTGLMRIAQAINKGS